MSDPLSPPKSVRKRSVLGFAAGVLAACLVFTWFRAQGPQAIVTLKGGEGFLGLLDGTAYLRVGLVATSVEIVAWPLRTGGKPRKVAQFQNPAVAANLTSQPVPEFLHLSAAGAVFRIRDPYPTQGFGGIAGSPGGPVRGPVRIPVPRTRVWTRQPRVHLWRIPLDGSKPAELLPERKAVEMFVVGDKCYWLGSELVLPGEPLVKPLDYRPKEELFVEPLSGGTPRKIAEFRDARSFLPGKRTFFWTTNLASGKPDLVVAREPDYSLTMIPDFRGWEPPVELRDRLYWVDGTASQAQSGTTRRHQVASCALDGSDRRVIFDCDPVTGNPYANIMALTESAGSLYFTLTSPWSHGNDGAPGSALYRFDPQENRPAHRVGRWPSTTRVAYLASDASSAYVGVTEKKENWLDWSPAGLAPKQVSRIFRVSTSR